MITLIVPAMVPVIAAIISGVASLAGGAMSAISTSRTNKKNIDNQWDMWNATNQYNTALQDVVRMKEAGLNANLAFGGTPYHASPVNIGNSQPVNFDFLGTSIANAFGMHQQTKHFQYDIENKELDRLMKNIQWSWEDERLQQQYDLNAQELANLKETFNKIQKEVDKIGQDIEASEAQELLTDLRRAHEQLNYDYDKSLYEQGLPPDLDPDKKAIAGLLASLLEAISFGKIDKELLFKTMFGN